MSTSTENTLHGKFDELAGKAKQAFGEATGNDKVANEGTAQQVSGHTEQAWGSVKGAAEEKYAEVKAEHEATAGQHAAEHENKAHDVRESIVSTAQNVKEKIEHALHGNKDHA